MPPSLIVIGIVAALREHLPSLDGWKVLLVAALASALIAIAAGGAPGVVVMAAAQLFVEAVGGVAGFKYAVKQLRGMAAPAAPAASPSTPPPAPAPAYQPNGGG